MPRPGANDELGRVLLNELFESDFVISNHLNCGAFEDEILVDVPSK